jgi:hypothetical protein
LYVLITSSSAVDAEYGKGKPHPGLSQNGDVYGLQDNWTLGGKLPGLSDEDAVTACNRSKDTTGTGSFVARTMWRQGGAPPESLESLHLFQSSLH